MFTFYVYYDDISGNLLSVTNELHQGEPYIVISKEEYVINEDKVKQIIYLSLQQLKTQNTLKYE